MPTNKKSVSFAPSEKNTSYSDAFSFEDRSSFWFTAKDFQICKNDSLESIQAYNYFAQLFGIIMPSPHDHSVRGLAYHLEEETNNETIIKNYVNCVLELQEEGFDMKQSRAFEMDPKKREKLLYFIDKNLAWETAKAQLQAEEDRSAADQIYEEDNSKISPTTEKLTVATPFLREAAAKSYSFSPKEIQPSIEGATTA